MQDKGGNLVRSREAASPDPLRPTTHRHRDPNAPDPSVIARQYYDLFNQRRFDEAAGLLSSDASFLHRPTKQRLIGPTGYRTFAEAWVRAFPDARVEITAIAVEAGAWVTVDFIGRGTHSGTLDLGEIRFPPTGRPVELPFRQRRLLQQRPYTPAGMAPKRASAATSPPSSRFPR